MVLGEGALAVQRRHHRRAEELREVDDLARRARVPRALAGDDERPARLGEQARRRLHVARVGHGRSARGGTYAATADSSTSAWTTSFGISTRTGPGGALRTAHQLGDALGEVDLVRPLHHAAIALGRAEVVRHAAPRPPGAAGEHEDGRAVGCGLGDARVHVLRAGPVLRRDDAGAPAVVHARVAIGHRRERALGARDDRPDALGRAGVDEAVRGEAEELRDALALEDPGDRRVPAHRCRRVAA